MNRSSLRLLPAVSVAFYCLGMYCLAEDKVQVVKDTDVKLGADVIGRVKAGDVLTKVRQQGEWVGVRYTANGKTVSGWVAKNSLVDVAAEVETAPATGEKPMVKPEGPRQAGRIGGALLTLRLRSVNEVAGKLQNLMMQVQPALAGAISPDALLAQIPQPLQDLARRAVDLDRPLGLVAYAPEGAVAEGASTPEPDFCLFIPVKEEDAAKELSQQQGLGNVAIKISGRYLLLGNKPATLEHALGDSTVVPGIEAEGFKSDLRVVLFMDTLWKAMEPELEKQLKAAMEKAAAAQGLQERKEALSEKFGVETMKFLINELKEMTFEIEIQEQGIRMGLSVESKPGTATAKFLKGLGEQPAADISGLVPSQNALFLEGIRLSGPELANFGKTVFAEIVKQGEQSGEIQPQDKEWVERFQKRVESLLEACLGSCALSVYEAQPGQVGIVAAVGTQGESMRDALSGLIADIQEREKLEGKPIEAVLKTNAREYNGISIDAVVLEREKKPNDMEIELVHMPGVTLLVIAKSVQPVTDAAIDQAKAGGGTPEVLVTAASRFDGQPIAVASLYLIKAMVMADKMEHEGESSMVGLGDGDQPLVGAYLLQNNRLVGELFIPIEPMRLIQAIIAQKALQGPREAAPEGQEQPQGQQF